jgi:hypothetical protein
MSPWQSGNMHVHQLNGLLAGGAVTAVSRGFGGVWLQHQLRCSHSMLTWQRK